MQKELNQYGLEPDSFTASVFRELSLLEEPKPGTVSRILIPILSEAKLGRIPRPNVDVSLRAIVRLNLFNDDSYSSESI